MDIAISKAGIEDLDMLMDWRMEVLHEVFPAHQNKNMEKLEIENRRYYQRELPSGGHIACFASIDGETAGCGGMCIYHEMPSPDNPSGSCAYLMNIYTRKQFRGCGIGRKTVEWLISEARGLNIEKIYLETSESGRSLYSKIGFKELSGYMMLK